MYPWGDRENHGTELSMRTRLTGSRRFEPTPRRSRRPLPSPRHLSASHKKYSPGLFESMRAVWEWYAARGQADPTLLALPVTGAALEKFLCNLWQTLSDHECLGMYLEEIGPHTTVMGLDWFELQIPCYDYNDNETAGVVEAFLSGVDGVHSLLAGFYDVADWPDFNLELPPQDRKLIETVGFRELVQTYHDYQGEKSVDLRALCDETSYFAAVIERFPKYEQHWPVLISGNGAMENTLSIVSPEDIDFALAYCEEYERMMNAMPYPYSFYENHEGTADDFYHEVCEVWRRANKKQPVKWHSPKGDTLAVRFRKGEI
jgi:hypothetical protein